MPSERTGSFGEHAAPSPVDRLGTWWGRAAFGRRVGPLTAKRVADLGQGVAEASSLAHNAPRLAAVRSHALEFAAAHRGAAQRTAAALAAVVRQATSANAADGSGKSLSP